MGACATAGGSARIAALAEELGYDSLWAAEHVVAPSPRVEPSPMEPDLPILDPLVALTHLAGVTQTVRLATGIVILPQRNPVVLAKQVASVDVLSGGRLILGIGVGYLEPEMSAVGVPMAGRGARADEYLRAMRSLWEDDAPAFAGDYAGFSGVDAHPRPVQRPLPVVVGGHSAAAHRRAVRYGHGWYGFWLDRREAAAQIESLRQAADAAGRDLSGFEITVSPSERLDPKVVAGYAELGVTRLAVVPRADSDLERLERFVRNNAPERVAGDFA